MKQVTALIFAAGKLTKDAHECVHAARLLTPNVIVVHIGGTDQKKAHIEGATVHPIDAVPYVEIARSRGISFVKTPWVFVLDADERMTPKLAQEIKMVLEHETSGTATHYQVPRKNIFAHTKWLRWGGWWPDYQTRLIHTPSIRNWPTRIHSTPSIAGGSARLKEPFEHYFHGDIHDMAAKTVKYEDIESQLLFEAGRDSGTLMFMRKFAGELYRRLIKGAGFRDGVVGWIESVYQAYSKTITYLYLFEKRYVDNQKNTS